jgi:hypothetical protein
MKKTVLAGCIALSMHSYSQNVIFADNFEMPSTNWELNSTGMGLNVWTINGSYEGAAAQSIPDVPNQPGTFMNAPQSQYLHIHNLPNCNGIVFVTCNANFDPNSASNTFTRMASDISTSAYSNVALSFWYLCGGEDNVSYGTVEYSTDSGMTWTPVGSPLFGVTTWTQVTLTDPAFDGQTNLRFRFGWLNGSQGINPPFSIDELSITGEMTGEMITMQHLNESVYCPGDEDEIGFEALGTYNAGNVFTAQLSDATGSFASPVTLGTLASSSSGIQSISGTFPVSTPAGTGYRVRVVASDPATIGGDNGEDVIINPLPAIDIASNPNDGTICIGSSAELTASGATTYQWTPAATLSSSSGTTVTATPVVTTTYTVTGTEFEGCTNTATFTVTVDDCAAIGEQNEAYLQLYPNPANDELHIMIASKDGVSYVDLLDETGRVLRSSGVSVNTGTEMMLLDMQIADLPQGLYSVRIVHANGSTVKRFTKK